MVEIGTHSVPAIADCRTPADGRGWRRAGTICWALALALCVMPSVLPAAAQAPGTPPAPGMAGPTPGGPGAPLPPAGELAAARNHLKLINADEADYDAETNRLIARGNVIAEYRDYRVTADVLDADFDERTATFRGRVVLTMPERTIHGTLLMLDLRNRSYELEGARVLIPPQEVGMGAVEPVYATGAHVIGNETQITILSGGVTTCNLVPPHYLFDARRITIIPGRRLEARKVSFYVLGHKLITYPGVTIPLTTANQQNSRLVPVVGQSADEGYYLKTAYFYILGALIGQLRLDLMSKKGFGVGLDQPYTSRNKNGTFHTYYLNDRSQRRQDLTFHEDHHQRFGQFDVQFAGDYRQNALDYVSAKSTSLLTDLGVRWTGKSGTSTDFGVNRSESGYGGSTTGNWIGRLRHTQTLAGIVTNLNFNLNQPFGISTANTGQLTSHLDMARSFFKDEQHPNGLVDISLAADRIDTLGTAPNYFVGIQRLPEIRFATNLARLFPAPAVPGQAVPPTVTLPSVGVPGSGPTVPGTGPATPGTPVPGETAPGETAPGPRAPLPGPTTPGTPAPGTPAPGAPGAPPGAPGTTPVRAAAPPPSLGYQLARATGLAAELAIGNLEEPGTFLAGQTSAVSRKRIRTDLHLTANPLFYREKTEEPRPNRFGAAGGAFPAPGVAAPAIPGAQPPAEETEPGRRYRPLRKATFTVPMDFRQLVYRSNEAQWVATFNPNFSYNLGPGSQFTFQHSVLRQNGYSPFQSDTFTQYNSASAGLVLGAAPPGGFATAYPGYGVSAYGSTGPLVGYGGYLGTAGGALLDPRYAGKASVSLRTGYDFENDIAQDLLLDARYQPDRHYQFSLSTGYDWQGKQLGFGSSRLRDIRGLMQVDYGQNFQLGLSTLWSTTKSQFSAIQASLNASLGTPWRLQAIYGKFATGFSQQYMLTRDLHCWQASMTFVSDQARINSGFTFYLTIKAFPQNNLFGISQSGGYLTPGTSQVY